MKVLITGGAGFIGFHLARYHADLGDTVELMDNLWKLEGRQDEELIELIGRSNVNFHSVNMLEPIARMPELDNFDIVYHLAAINGTAYFYDRPYEVASTNLMVTVNLLKWLEKKQVGTLIYSSTSEVYAGADSVGALNIPTDESVPVVFAQPTNKRFSYGTAKFIGEVLCRFYAETHPVRCAVIRYHNIYGPRMGTKHVIPEFVERAIRRENPFTIFGGEETRAFCYVSDAVRATAMVGKCEQASDQIIHIGNPDETRIAELAVRVCQLVGYEPQLREMGRRAGSVARRCPSIEKLHSLTGFVAQVGLSDGLVMTYDWYKLQGN